MPPRVVYPGVYSGVYASQGGYPGVYSGVYASLGVIPGYKALGSLFTYTRFTVGLYLSLPSLYPFHCWAIPEPPLSSTRFTVGLYLSLFPFTRFTVGLGISSFHPFHCWVRKTRSQALLLPVALVVLLPALPVSLLDTRPHTVNTRFTVGHTPDPGPPVPTNLSHS